MPEAARVVLDTNVLLSLFVFADSRYARLRERLTAGELIALADAAQRAAFDAYTALSGIVPAAAEPLALPQCRDPDDQKFLEVARDGNADWLVTSDKALLKLARRRKLAHLFAIITPERALEIQGGFRPPRAEKPGCAARSASVASA